MAQWWKDNHAELREDGTLGVTNVSAVCLNVLYMRL